MADPRASHADFLRSLSVLYVEDDAEVRGQLARFLERRVKRLVVSGDSGLCARYGTAPRRIHVGEEYAYGDYECENGKNTSIHGEKAIILWSSDAESTNETEPSLLMLIFEKMAPLMR